LISLCAVVAALVAVAALPVSGAAGSVRPAAHAAANCNISKVWHKLGPTYVEALSVSGTSCATGVNLIRAYNKCRLKSGGLKGHCASADGFRCSEKRSSSPVQFVAQVRCTKGREVVTFSYSENT
jgi:hypothetical protein